MTEADVLAATYDDLCSVYRPQKVTLSSGESAFLNGVEGKLVYMSMPCALSSMTGGKPYKSKTTVQTSSDYCLFVRPEVDIIQGDTVVVSHLGKTQIMLAGVPDRQSSHNNIPLKPQKENA